MMNNCCQRAGNAHIHASTDPSVCWRVICGFCGLIIHEEKRDQ